MAIFPILQLCFLLSIISHLPTLLLARSTLPVSRSSDRFAVTIRDLHRMCETNGVSLFESVLHFHIPYMNVSTTATRKIFDSISAAHSTAGLDLLTEEHCRQNSDIGVYLQHFTNLVQTCMDENHRLNEEKMKKVMDMFLKRVCSDLEYDALEKYDTDCFKDDRTRSDFVDCYGSAEPRGVVFENDYMLPVLNFPTKNECTGLFKYYECVVFSVQSCEESTRKIVKDHFDEKKSFSGCGNIVNQV